MWHFGKSCEQDISLQVIPDAKYFTLLRDPVDSFESNYVYMGLQNAFKMDINQFAEMRTGPNVRTVK